MKKTLLSLGALAALTIPASAKPTIYATYGGYTQMDCMDMHDNFKGVKTAWGSLNVGVDFKVAPKLSLGPSYTFSSASIKHNGNAYYHVIMLNGKYDYYRTGILTLYAHLGVGADISHMAPKYGDTENKGYFAFQVAPVGARVELGSGFNFIGEIGFGAQGLAQFGFSYDF